MELPFGDRSEAGRFLAAELARHKLPPNTVILALPRGGVPVGFEVAQALKYRLDVIAVRKLGVPWHPELAIGAIAGETRVLDREAIRILRIPEHQLLAIIDKETCEMNRREELYRKGLPPLDLRGRTAVLVDDGLATGSTMSAGVKHVRSMHPERVLVAVPVASREACAQLANEADECICLACPEPFFAVGKWYRDFRSVTDSEVHNLLRPDRQPPESSHSSSR